MEKKLSWEEISNSYDKEWIQLIDYDWSEEEPLPRNGVVVAHARERKMFDQLILQTPQKDSAIIFVGERTIPDGTLLSANLHQWNYI